jgi:hypothetical protein
MMQRTVAITSKIQRVGLQPVGESSGKMPEARTLGRRAGDLRMALQRVAGVSGKEPITPAEAVESFLGDMIAAAERTFPNWRQRLVPSIEECCTGYDMRRAVLDQHPLEDYYFAGVVGLEAAKIRRLLPPPVSAELLSLIAERVDALARRNDHVVADLMFATIIRIHVDSGVDKLKRDYDQVCKTILLRMGVDQCEATKHLMRDLYYRHNLGEPLALGVPQWWKAFIRTYQLVNAGAAAVARQ